MVILIEAENTRRNIVPSHARTPLTLTACEAREMAAMCMASTNDHMAPGGQLATEIQSALVTGTLAAFAQ
jgi:hypothetical protein